MKKIFAIAALLFALVACVPACTCSHEQQANEEVVEAVVDSVAVADSAAVAVDSTLVVE